MESSHMERDQEQPVSQVANSSAYAKGPHKASTAAFVSDSIGMQAGLGGAEALLNTVISAWPNVPIYAPMVDRAELPTPVRLDAYSHACLG